MSRQDLNNSLDALDNAIDAEIADGAANTAQDVRGSLKDVVSNIRGILEETNISDETGITTLFEDTVGVGNGTVIDWSIVGNASDFDELRVVCSSTAPDILVTKCVLISAFLRANTVIQIDYQVANLSKSNVSQIQLNNIEDSGCSVVSIGIAWPSPLLYGIYGVKY